MATAVAKGPLRILLQTSAGQYVLMGIGAYALFPEKFHKVLEYSPALMKLVNGNNNGNNESNRSLAPIIIHTPSPTVIGGGGGNRTWMGTIAYSAAGATACWAGYVVLVQVLPDTVGQFLPVTRTIFDKTSQSLGKGILHCKKVLEEKILILSGQQEELGKKQDDTNKTVSHIKSELGEARIDLTMLQSSMDRCEGSLEKTEGMQQYTLRGVRLLVRCVANMLPDNQETADELSRFIEEEQRHLLLANNGNQDNTLATPDKSGVVSGDLDNIPMVNAAHATPLFTPPASLSRRRSSSARRISDISSISKRNLNTMDDLQGGTSDDEAPFKDIKALLGH